MDTKQFIISKISNALLTIIIVGGLLLFLNYKIKDYFKDKEVRDAVEVSKLEERVSELQRFIDTNIVQAQHSIVTEKQLKKELETILKDNKELRKYIDNNNEEVKRFIKAEFTLGNQTGGGKGEVTETKSESGAATSNYTFSDNYLDFTFSLESLLAKYNIKLSNIPLELNIIQTELPDGRFKLNDYIVMKRTDTGEEIHIKNATVQEVMQQDKLFRKNITSTIGVSYNGEINGDIGVSIFSYGRTLSPKDTEYRFLNLGISGNTNNIGLYIVPATWNLGKIIPFIQEAQIGPGYYFDIINQKHLLNFSILHNF